MVEVEKNPNGRCVVCPKWQREKQRKATKETQAHITVEDSIKNVVKMLLQRYRTLDLKATGKVENWGGLLFLFCWFFFQKHRNDLQ